MLSKPGKYKNEEIIRDVFEILKKNLNVNKNQYVYISKVLPSGHWKLRIKKEINDRNIIIKTSLFEKNIISITVLNWAILYIETNRNCEVKFLEIK